MRHGEDALLQWHLRPRYAQRTAPPPLLSRRTRTHRSLNVAIFSMLKNFEEE